MALVSIDRRFRGPPDSGNGGYVAGLVAAALGGSDCAVTLRRPPPLGTPLQLEREGDGAALRDGDELVASAGPAAVAIEPPTPPAPAEAEAAQADYAGRRHHIFPGCFVCGPERGDGDGLRIFPGRVAGGAVAALWTPDAGLAGEDGSVLGEFVWAALDCPGYWAVREAAGLAVLGRLAARIERPVRAGEPLVVTGWGLGRDGRKHRAGTALHDARGRLVAAAEAVWVTLAR